MATVIITAVQWDAVALAQGNFGIPDNLVAQILNCNPTIVRGARTRGGWGLRDLDKAHSGLTGWRGAEGGRLRWKKNIRTNSNDLPSTDTITETLAQLASGQEEESHYPDSPELTLEVLTIALSRELNAAASGMPDAAALKRVDGLVAAAKALEKLMALGPKAADDPLADEEVLAVEERVRLLAQMDKRVEELAEQLAQEIRNERSEASTN